MTVIRLSRHGSKKRPYYRIVVQDHTAPRDGKFIEHIGAYDPIKGDGSITIKEDRLNYWLQVGAKMSETVSDKIKIYSKNKPVAAEAKA